MGGGDREDLVVTGDIGGDPGVGKVPLDVVEVDPHPVRLDPSGESTDHRHEPGLGVAATDVAGTEFADGGPGCEIGGLGGVAEHDVRAGVDDLAGVGAGDVDVRGVVDVGGDGDVGGVVDVAGRLTGGIAVRHPLQRPDLDRTAGDRQADRTGVGAHGRRWHERHAGGRLGRPVHRVPLGVPAPGALGPRRHLVGGHLAARLRHEAQRRHANVFGAGLIEQVVGVGNPRQVRHPVFEQQRPEARVDDRGRGGDDAATDGEVRMQDRESEAVTHREARDADVAAAQALELGDRGGVREQVADRELHQLRVAGRSARAHQQSEIGMEFGARRRRVDVEMPVIVIDARPDAQGRSRGPPLDQPVDVVTREQWDVTSGQQRQIGDDPLDPVVAGEDDDRPLGQPGRLERRDAPLDPLGEVAVGDRAVSVGDRSEGTASWVAKVERVDRLANVGIRRDRRHPDMLRRTNADRQVHFGPGGNYPLASAQVAPQATFTSSGTSRSAAPRIRSMTSPPTRSRSAGATSTMTSSWT